MPDRGDERGRGGTRTLVTGILAGTEWHPATNPQEATQTARAARDLAVRLRPVLSKLAQAPRGGRRRDLEWLPAVEQLAVDAQYFASWWLPRLEGKSAQSWPSWSADGYADWVKRLDAQRLRTLEMVEGTAPVTRIASVTQLRRGKGAAVEAEAEAEADTTVGTPVDPAVDAAAEETPAPAVASLAEPHSPARHAREDHEDHEDHNDAVPAESAEEERSARITPLRGPGAALMDAALMDMAGASDVPGMRTEESEPGLSADETHISRATPVSAAPRTDVDPDAGADADTYARSIAESTVPPTPEPVVTITDLPSGSPEDSSSPVPRTPPNQGPVTDDPDTTHIQRPPADSAPLGFDDLASDASDASDASEAALPRVPRTPPNQGPAETDSGVGAEIVQIPRTPPNKGPADADLPRIPRTPIVSLVGDDDSPRVPRTPPNSGPSAGPAAEDDANATHISLAPVGPAALATGADEVTRPLFRPDPPTSPPSASTPAAAALAGAALGAGAIGSGSSGGSGGSGDFGGSAGSSPSGRDEFENFQPGSDLPPPVFPMTEPVEPVDRGRIARYALAAVVLAAGGVLAVVLATEKGSGAKTAAAPRSTSSSSSTAGASTGDSSSAVPGAVTAPTATDTPGASPTSSKPVVTPPKPSSPASSAPKSAAAPSHTSAAAPPPPPQTTHQQPPPAGGVRSLSVSSLAPDQTGSYNYVAHVHVTTSGTGTVTVTVTFAGTGSSNSPGSTGAQSQSFTLSGKTSYDIDPQLDVHGMCVGSGQQPYIDAVASASGAGSSVAYASSPC